MINWFNQPLLRPKIKFFLNLFFFKNSIVFNLPALNTLHYVLPFTFLNIKNINNNYSNILFKFIILFIFLCLSFGVLFF